MVQIFSVEEYYREQVGIHLADRKPLPVVHIAVYCSVNCTLFSVMSKDMLIGFGSAKIDCFIKQPLQLRIMTINILSTPLVIPDSTTMGRTLLSSKLRPPSSGYFTFDCFILV